MSFEVLMVSSLDVSMYIECSIGTATHDRRQKVFE
jgi:hypothetical protein